MNLLKQELRKTFLWTRNGTAFAVTWILMLLLAAGHALNVSAISISLLTKMVLLVAGGAFLFSVSFTRLIFLRWKFIGRLSFFFAALGFYQTAGLCWLGFLGENSTMQQWLIYGFTVVAFYLSCLVIFQVYSKSKKKAYTRALNEYQKKGENRNGK